MLIYIASAYSAPTPAERQANVDRAMDAALALLGMGHTPFCPHLSHYLDERAAQLCGERIPYERWIDYDLEWLRACDGLLYLASSPGADFEMQAAIARMMPVYKCLAEVPGV